MTDVVHAWQQIVDALNIRSPQLAATLPPPATAAELATCETVLGFALPAELTASLLQHGFGSNFLSQIEFLGPLQIADEYCAWRDILGVEGLAPEPVGPVSSSWWESTWIPFTVIHGSSHHHCVDLAPAPGGTPGQIIEIYKDDGRRVVVAPSLAAWLTAIAQDIEAGVYQLGTDEALELDEDQAEGRTLGGFRYSLHER